MGYDVTDATFEAEVVQRSHDVVVVVDLWAPWCGPCRTLGPILEKVVDETDGVVLAKIDVDQNPAVAQAFRVQSIPAVYALRDGKVVNGFMGALGEREVREFVRQLLPSPEESRVAELLAVGDETSLREALELVPGHEGAVVALAELLVGRGATDEALALLEKIPESPATRRVAAMARTGVAVGGEDIEAKLADLLDRVHDDAAARQEFVDLLELLGPDDERTAQWRKRLTARLY